jgi:hypothetical protein
MGVGVIEGGWEFVAAAYIVSALVLTGYATSVFLRYRAEKSRAATHAGRETKP